MENREEIFELLNSLLENKKYSEFMKAIDELNDIDAADYLESLPAELERVLGITDGVLRSMVIKK